MDRFEMGGYLPLELRHGRNRFSHIPEEYCQAVNTGRTALWCAINSLGVHRVLAPYYYCPDIISMLESMEICVDYYRIDENFMPVDVANDVDSAVILVNYFGIMGEEMYALSDTFSNVIFDNAHAFFAEPVMKNNVMNIYSCRKFLGVCDGAYVVGKGLKKTELERDVSSDRAIHLLKSLELGTNAVYMESKHNEHEIGKRHLAMSVLTERILESVDYDAVVRKRMQNFRYLHSHLEDIQGLNIKSDDPVPYAYPLLLNCDIHKELVKEKVFVPLLWSQLLDAEWADTIEQTYSAHIVPLPLDQRYGEAELDWMIGKIRTILESKAEMECKHGS